MAVLRLENISKRFGKLWALSDINLEIPDGRFCVILGPSGCGKSTLLNLIAGLEEPTTGRIYLGDKDITKLASHKRDIAMVFQNYALYPHLSVFENMAFGLRVKGFNDDEIRSRIERVSRILNIEDKLNSFPKELSGGQRQRVATGRAIAREPRLFLFDEPLSNLDARLRIELRAEFIKLHRQLKRTVVYVTHDQVEAMVLGEMVVVINDGCIQQISDPIELYQNPRNLFVAKFIGIPPMNIIELRLIREDKELSLEMDNFKLRLTCEVNKRLNELINKKVYLGVRPSGIELSSDGQNEAEIMFIETIGEDSFVHLRLSPTIEINVRLRDRMVVKTGKSVRFNIDFSRVYLFDEHGDRIYL